MEENGAKELAALSPAPQTIKVAGRTVEIKQCSIAQAGRIFDAGMPLYLKSLSATDFLELFETDPETTSALVAVATDLEREFVDGLEPIDRFTIAAKWIEVNGAFFVQRLLPALSMFAVGLARIDGRGQNSSTSSSAPGTSTRSTTRLRLPDDMPPPLPKGSGASAVSA